jgi:hypothetical protein
MTEMEKPTMTVPIVGAMYAACFNCAAQAVVAVSLGAEVDLASVNADGIGELRLRFPSEATGDDLADAHAAIWLAGAPALHLRGKRPMEIKRLTAHDSARAMAAVKDRVSRFRRANARARILVRDEWDAIQNIAVELERRRLLPGGEVAAWCDERQRNSRTP